MIITLPINRRRVLIVAIVISKVLGDTDEPIISRCSIARMQLRLLRRLRVEGIFIC